MLAIPIVIRNDLKFSLINSLHNPEKVINPSATNASLYKIEVGIPIIGWKCTSTTPSNKLEIIAPTASIKKSFLTVKFT